MIKMVKDDMVCDVASSQMDIMRDSGWQTEKEAAKAKPAKKAEKAPVKKAEKAPAKKETTKRKRRSLKDKE
jgi:hypothetical protein